MEKHYDNSKGSLYKFAEDQNLNAWEFDLVKRIVRSRKKGNFKQDLEKTKFLIDLYLEEYEEENSINKPLVDGYYYLVDGDVIECGDEYYDTNFNKWLINNLIGGKLKYNREDCYKTRRKIV
jgi:hypothetical protein